MKIRTTLGSMRAAWWAARATWQVRMRLRESGFDDCRVSAPPNVPREASRGVNAALGLLRPSCLERAIVVQRWLFAQGEPRDVVVGVAGSLDTFRAHAWVDGEADPRQSDFKEITRLRP